MEAFHDSTTEIALISGEFSKWHCPMVALLSWHYPVVAMLCQHYRNTLILSGSGTVEMAFFDDGTMQ